MKRTVLGILVAATSAAFLVAEAEAKRLGGGRSVGAQRSVTAAPPAAAPAKPAQQAQPAAPTQAHAAAPAAQGPVAQPQGASGLARWMPVLGGLALGGALGWLLGANGLAGLAVGILLVGLIIVAVAFALRALLRRAPAAQPVQYAGLGAETVVAPPPSQMTDREPLSAAAAARTNVPADFDVAAFLRNARFNFMRLQAANDEGDLDELREFTTPELFEALRRDIEARGGARQRTDITALHAELLEVGTEGDRHWASVRFSGMVREAPGAAAEGFEEVWNLVKPADGSSGWLLAGIQQMH
ncbi:MAG: Tim44-like domain-containing protein [Burkholderiales bacterium]|nr:Tim44-like domain-containing protein [Burkholderiales bacterium]